MKTDSLNSSSGAFLERSNVKPNHSQPIIASTTTFDASDVGSDHILSVDCVITLPATAVGSVYTCIAGADDVEITLSPNASDKILGGCGLAAQDDNKDLIYSNGKKGDCVQVTADGTHGWYVTYLSSKGNVSIES
tara:strand:+ start:83 stop:487 length:405 start_codon:yes stop_codon:yes gene_type:complete